MLTQGVPWTVIDMAWWKGQYVVALVRLVPEDPTSPTNYCLRVHPCGNLDPSAVLASVQLPTGVTPTRVCVGSTNAVHSVGTARVGNWVAVAAESADG